MCRTQHSSDHCTGPHRTQHRPVGLMASAYARLRCHRRRLKSVYATPLACERRAAGGRGPPGKDPQLLKPAPPKEPPPEILVVSIIAPVALKDPIAVTLFETLLWTLRLTRRSGSFWGSGLLVPSSETNRLTKLLWVLKGSYKIS